ncbi:serine/threonine-protein kinase tsuA, partial [Asbolus verrucosus]
TIEKRQICSNNGCGSCDGKSCNICNNNACCSSQSCNQCVNQCSNNCNTVTCKNNCVSGCSNNCQSQSCSVQSCSQCVNQCSNQCSTNQCVDNCSSKCDCKEKPIDPLEPPIIMEPSQPTSVNVNNTNNNVVNLTTHINISNLVHNFNNISVPVFVNTTNINYINITDINESKQPYPYPYPYQPQIPSTPIHDNCCYIMHPKTCYTEENGNRRCYIRRHRECSSSCTSPVVTIQEDPEVTSSGCHYINSYPYAYCGNYIAVNAILAVEVTTHVNVSTKMDVQIFAEEVFRIVYQASLDFSVIRF